MAREEVLADIDAADLELACKMHETKGQIVKVTIRRLEDRYETVDDKQADLLLLLALEEEYKSYQKERSALAEVGNAVTGKRKELIFQRVNALGGSLFKAENAEENANHE